MYKSDGTEWFPPEVYVHVHLVRRSFWYRLKYGLKYIFGYKSRYGAWDEFILDNSHVKETNGYVMYPYGLNSSYKDCVTSLDGYQPSTKTDTGTIVL
jgi:hypothetical protein